MSPPKREAEPGHITYIPHYLLLFKHEFHVITIQTLMLGLDKFRVIMWYWSVYIFFISTARQQYASVLVWFVNAIIKSLTQHMHHKHFRVWKRQKRVLTPCRTSDTQQCCIRRTPRLCDSFLCSFLFPCCSAASFIPFSFFCFSGICFCKKVADFASLLASLWFERSCFFVIWTFGWNVISISFPLCLQETDLICQLFLILPAVDPFLTILVSREPFFLSVTA